MVRRPLIIGSQKLFLPLCEAVELGRRIAGALADGPVPFEIVVCPSLVNLAHVAKALSDSPVAVAAQNVHQEAGGAFTGQVSLQELLDLQVRYVIIGHREVLAYERDAASTRLRKIAWC